MGASGGTGGSGDAVTVSSTADITATGPAASGIIARSVGGGGGDSTSTAIAMGSQGDAGQNELTQKLTASVGASGAAAGDAGAVTATSSGVLQIGVPGEDVEADPQEPEHVSIGIWAQSIGGGGGAGGTSYSYPLSVGGKAQSISTSISVGGKGGAGGAAGAVKVVQNGSVITQDLEGHAVFAQSVGGGGGKGTTALQIGASSGVNGGSLTAGITVGGQGSGGGAASTVEIDNNGLAQTFGDNAHGLYAQSVGGGGGDGGSGFGFSIGVNRSSDPFSSRSLSVQVGGASGAGGDANSATVTSNAGITTSGDGSYGIFAQSVGGGGGDAGNEPSGTPLNSNQLRITVGGQSGANGDGGAVSVSHLAGPIATSGTGSVAIYAQSVGGGGGRGGVGQYSEEAEIALGGGDNASGVAGDVTVFTQSGQSIRTTGDSQAYGIWAQSVGGGGGHAGGAAFGLLDTVPSSGQAPKVGAGLSLGGGTSDGDGGAVLVTHKAGLQTTGTDAIGIFAQSVGGGGGVTGGPGDIDNCDPDACATVAGSGRGTGQAGPVTVYVDGSLEIEGLYSHGVFAQSASGTDKPGGAVTVEVGRFDAGGYIALNGSDANGIWAQSEGGAGSAPIAITVHPTGSVRGGSGNSAGVRLMGGTGNTLVNDGASRRITASAEWRCARMTRSPSLAQAPLPARSSPPTAAR